MAALPDIVVEVDEWPLCIAVKAGVRGIICRVAGCLHVKLLVNACPVGKPENNRNLLRIRINIRKERRELRPFQNLFIAIW